MGSFFLIAGVLLMVGIPRRIASLCIGANQKPY
jgi:hypothetical protein